MFDPARLLEARDTARRDLLAERVPAGHWVGELASSALSTATAVSALWIYSRHASDSRDSRAGSFNGLIARGLDWLARHQNPDGGWGDTDQSLSNIATTMLVRAAFHLAAAPGTFPFFGSAEKGDCPPRCPHPAFLTRAEGYVESQGGISGLRRRYGRDKTFAVPILANCALAGLVPWREVAALPFEMACLPHWLLGLMRLPVVSYAVPALVAIGQARYFHLPPRNPLVRLVRRLAVRRSLAVLEAKQPISGGFLEATPLTSFVVMALAGTGRAEHPVARRGVQFLLESVRPDGSWPIDTNLATWVTTLAINALGMSPISASIDSHSDRSVRRKWDLFPSCSPSCLDWLLKCQHMEVHPFTAAAPGGWGWTDLSGAVPDADDTPGALLALAGLRGAAAPDDIARIDAAARRGLAWLLDLQNRDGGWPTFCRGWGALPFDRSGSDLTAHALRALGAWREAAAAWPDRIAPGRTSAAIARGLAFLARQQRPDGSWTPLWFGNQHHPDEENPVYGTARVLLAYRDLGRLDDPPARRGMAWLRAHQNADRGWGGGPEMGAVAGTAHVSSVEETAVALEALLAAENGDSPEPVVEKGLGWLVEAVLSGRHRRPWPIGFYFARLWYYERLYPLVFTVAALNEAVRRFGPASAPNLH